MTDGYAEAEDEQNIAVTEAEQITAEEGAAGKISEQDISSQDPAAENENSRPEDAETAPEQPEDKGENK